MANTDLVLSMPVDSAGVQPICSATSWAFGAWLPLHQDLTRDIAIVSLHFQLTYTPIPAADSTLEHIFEIGTGQGGLEVTKIQVPYSVRVDTAVGIYLDTRNFFLPEPLMVPAFTRVSVRVAASNAAATTFNGVKMRYQAVSPLVEQRWAGLPNNYQHIQTYGDMWVGERIR